MWSLLRTKMFAGILLVLCAGVQGATESTIAGVQGGTESTKAGVQGGTQSTIVGVQGGTESTITGSGGGTESTIDSSGDGTESTIAVQGGTESTMDSSGDGCDCQSMTEQMTRLEASVSDRLKLGDLRDDQQAEEIAQLFSLVKRNSNSTDQLSEQISSLTAQMENNTNASDILERQVQNLTSLIADIDFRNTALKKRVDELCSRLNQTSARLDSAEARLEEIPERPPGDCSELPEGSESGVHLLQLGTRGGEPVPAYCDLETHGGNWTVIQRRGDFGRRENFNRRWADYSKGFGKLAAEFWWGLENMWAMTSTKDKKYELRIDLEDFQGEKRHAIYQGFRISSEADGYRLTVANFAGDAGDSLSDLSGQQFTTRDKDQDLRSNKNCARGRRGGWWYRLCESNLNGRYISVKQRPGRRFRWGIFNRRSRKSGSLSWNTFSSRRNPLKTVTMKIRPTPEKQ